MKIDSNTVPETNITPDGSEIVERLINRRHVGDDANNSLLVHLAQVQRSTKVVDAIRLLPRKSLVASTEVTIRRSLLVHRPAKIQIA